MLGLLLAAFRSGYQYSQGRLPSLHSCSHAEIASFFDVENMTRKYSWRQILVSMVPMANWLLMMVGAILIVAAPVACVALYQQRFEPLEHQMPRDEYFRNFKYGCKP